MDVSVCFFTLKSDHDALNPQVKPCGCGLPVDLCPLTTHLGNGSVRGEGFTFLSEYCFRVNSCIIGLSPKRF